LPHIHDDGGFRSTDNLIAVLYFTAARLDLPATH
jgi:hypothetical protein